MPHRPFIASIVLMNLLMPQPGSAAEHTQDSLVQVEKNIREGKAVLVDVRERDETDDGYVAGAILWSLSMLSEQGSQPDFGDKLAAQVPKKKILYTYCKMGGRALMAVEMLEKFGYDVRALRHGFDDLAREGFKTARPKK